jgi:ferrochelatase
MPDPSGATAVLLMAYGTPTNLDDAEAYYTHIRRGHKPSPDQLHELVERYRAVGGRTPLLEIVKRVSQALQQRLSEGPRGHYRVYIGMKHWHPFIEETVEQIVRDGAHEIVGLPLAPHYSRMSIGEYRHAVEEALQSAAATIPLRFIESWHRNPLYVQAVADKVRSALADFPADQRENVQVIFSAHSLPTGISKWNDPYPEEMRESSEAVARAAGLASWGSAWQSAGRTQERWLGPDIRDVLSELADQGHRQVLSVPFGFVIDNLETVYDIDIELRQLAAERGVTFKRADSLNNDPALIDALADIVLHGTGASIVDVALAEAR